MSSKIKKSELRNIIKEIVKGVFKEMTGTSAVSPVTGPNAFKEPPKEEQIDEENSSANISTPSIPAAFTADGGGSKRGVAGSNSLGYELTNIGKKEMQIHGDKL